MSVYSKVESGTNRFRSRFHKSISYSKRYDCMFGEYIPVLSKFCLPGDVWKIGGNALVRFHPMVTPSLTPNYMKVRYFFVPLRLVEPNTELIITGSKDGHLSSGTLPKFENFVANANKVSYPNAYKVQKYSFWDYMGVQPGDYENIKNDACLPSKYWLKAYLRIKWDYYDDENISPTHINYSDFDSYISAVESRGADYAPDSVQLKKDYFTSALPWQLKAPGGIAPAIDVVGSATFTPNFTGTLFESDGQNPQLNHPLNQKALYVSGDNPYYTDLGLNTDNSADLSTLTNNKILNFLNASQQNVVLTGLGFNVDDMRTVNAETRVYERLARCGSRYTEYLNSNFGIAPADETLQRAQYLGGWSLPIVTTEVLQTAADGSTPVGTMRGHGITNGGNTIGRFLCKEFGMLFGLAHIVPQTEYTTGIPKELTYKERWDFFNPSFQHLSEQEVKNGELFISSSDGKNDDTFGFQAYANELRTSVNQTVGDLRDSLSYWTQSIHFTSRPNLNIALLSAGSHRGSFNAPFAVNSTSARPCIVDFYNDLDVYRPMVRYSTPGLVDHL